MSLDAALVAAVDRSLARMRAMVGPGLRLSRVDLLEHAIRAYLREQTVCSTDPADDVLTDSPILAPLRSKLTQN